MSETVFLNKICDYNSRTALIAENGVIVSYQALLKTALEIKERLISFNAKKGDVLVIEGDFSTNSIACLLAAIELNLTIVPLHANQYKSYKSELGAHVVLYNVKNDSLSEKKGAVKNAYLESLALKDEAHFVIFTSGTTGKPKGIVHSFKNLIYGKLEQRPSSLNILLFLQFDHIGGLNTLLECLSRGNTISLSQSKSPATVIELIEKNQVHVLPTTPSYLNLLMSNSSFDSKKLKSLKLITYGTEPVVEETLVRLKKHLPKCRIKQTFGTTELGILPVNSLSATSTAISFENESYETKIENGTLWVKSKKRALGNLKGETSAEWHNTHDKVIDLKNGYFKLIGNETSVINVGGNKVSALEIENHIMKLPNVVDCTVYAEKNPLIGEFVVCDVILNSEQPPKEASSHIKKHCANSLKSYQVPVKVKCVSELRHSNRFKKLR